MDPRIKSLKSTTFCGQRLRRQQIDDIQQTVALFPRLSRNELGHTICEHMRWKTPRGNDRVRFAQRVLEELERRGILTLPALNRNLGRGRQRTPELTARSAPQPVIEPGLAELVPLTLEVVTAAAPVAEWNEWVQRYHPLGYRQPFGQHLRYFVRDRQGRLLGCLLFSYAARRVGCRDEWIGWQHQRHRKQLHLLLCNGRFLLLPWVRVKCLASKVLGQAARQLPRDWQRLHGSRPVLLETYVNLQRHRGTCYRAANWQLVGRTQGRKAKGGAPAQRPKGVFVYPLRADWRTILLHGPRAVSRPRQAARPPAAPQTAGPGTEEEFVSMWRRMVETLTRVAQEHDREWLRRQRLLNTLLVVLFVYRLVLAPARQGYAATLAELWEQCRRLDVELPKPTPVSASSMCAARYKVHEQVFLQIHRALLQAAGPPAPSALWRGHRVYAVDGSKLNLPRPLLGDGYRLPAQGAHYPQGLVSCLYQLRSRVPLDFDLVAHHNERRAALAHLPALAPGAVVVYDRGYYSFQLLQAHLQRGLHAVFRLQRNANTVFDDFIASDCAQRVVDVPPPAGTRPPSGPGPPPRCRVRLVRYSAGGTTFFLATTLLQSKRYRVAGLARLYHARWGIEELYKISKQTLQLEPLHGRNERTVKQEVFAHFNLIAMTRLFTNRSEEAVREAAGARGKPAWQANFQNGLRTVARDLEGLLLRQASLIRESVRRIPGCIGRCGQRRRPGRSYPRRSYQPANKWNRRKRKAPPAAS